MWFKNVLLKRSRRKRWIFVKSLKIPISSMKFFNAPRYICKMLKLDKNFSFQEWILSFSAFIFIDRQQKIFPFFVHQCRKDAIAINGRKKNIIEMPFFFRILYKSCLLPTKLRRKFLKFLSFDPKGIRYYREYLMERRTCWEITYGYIERFNNKIETSSLGALEYKRRTKHNRLSLYKQRRTSSHDHYHCSNRWIEEIQHIVLRLTLDILERQNSQRRAFLWESYDYAHD